VKSLCAWPASLPTARWCRQNTTGNGLGGGLYVDPSAHVTADTATLIAGNQASKSNNDVWGTIKLPP
jgi:hypothetical protein